MSLRLCGLNVTDRNQAIPHYQQLQSKVGVDTFRVKGVDTYTVEGVDTNRVKGVDTYRVKGVDT